MSSLKFHTLLEECLSRSSSRSCGEPSWSELRSACVCARATADKKTTLFHDLYFFKHHWGWECDQLNQHQWQKQCCIRPVLRMLLTMSTFMLTFIRSCGPTTTTATAITHICRASKSTTFCCPKAPLVLSVEKLDNLSYTKKPYLRPTYHCHVQKNATWDLHCFTSICNRSHCKMETVPLERYIAVPNNMKKSFRRM